MQILILENKTLKQKLNAASKNDSGNDFNPEFLKLQAELNKRESENLMLQEKVDMLEQSLNNYGGVKQEQTKKRKPQSDFINQGYDSEGNEIEAQGSFEEQ